MLRLNSIIWEWTYEIAANSIWKLITPLGNRLPCRTTTCLDEHHTRRADAATTLFHSSKPGLMCALFEIFAQS
jgi:hypothetical protein